MGEMRIMTPYKEGENAGHIQETWDSTKPAEVDHARKTYEDFTKNKHYFAFRAKKDGKPGEKMDKFDPDAEAIILQPMLAGG